MGDAAYRDLVLVNEARTELKGSIAAWIGLAIVTTVLAFEFAPRAEPIAFAAWLTVLAALLLAWLAAWVGFMVRPPSDQTILKRWIPGAKAGMTLCNLATAGSVWIFLPVAGPDLRALLLMLFAWYLIIQFAAATEATQVLRSATILVLGSLTAWLLVEQPPYFAQQCLFLPLFGATLIAIRRFVREAVTTATAARAQADLARRDLADALVRLERERDAKTQFIRAVSHDLQQPLQAAALFANRLKPGGRAADQTPVLSGLGRALGAARTLVGAMLDHLKLDGGGVQAHLETIAAADIFDGVLATQGPAAAEAGVRITLAGGRIPLHADPALLTRAVENLVANAIRHSGGRRVLLGVRARRGETTIWVIDDGRGLAPGDETRIFGAFEQGAHVGAAGGFGLGLAATQGLVALMGGTCGAMALRQGGGAAFYIRLPAASARTEDLSCAA